MPHAPRRHTTTAHLQPVRRVESCRDRLAPDRATAALRQNAATAAAHLERRNVDARDVLDEPGVYLDRLQLARAEIDRAIRLMHATDWPAGR